MGGQPPGKKVGRRGKVEKPEQLCEKVFEMVGILWGRMGELMLRNDESVGDMIEEGGLCHGLEEDVRLLQGVEGVQGIGENGGGAVEEIGEMGRVAREGAVEERDELVLGVEKGFVLEG